MPLAATAPGALRAASTVAESPGHPGATASYPLVLNSSTHGPQESLCNHSPWTKTTDFPVMASSLCGCCLAAFRRTYVQSGPFPSGRVASGSVVRGTGVAGVLRVRTGRRRFGVRAMDRMPQDAVEHALRHLVDLAEAQRRGQARVRARRGVQREPILLRQERGVRRTVARRRREDVVHGRGDGVVQTERLHPDD